MSYKSGQEKNYCLFVTLAAVQLLLPSVVCSDHHEYFSSIAGLDHLLKTEEILLVDLRNYIDSSRAYLNALESTYDDMVSEHNLANANVENYLTNPVNVYRLMKRLENDWAKVEENVNDVGTYFLAIMSKNRETLNFPTDHDVKGAALALARLQETYKLDVTQVAAGFLNGIKYGNSMSWQDCLILGQHLYEMEEYNHTKLWMKESMKLLSREQYSDDPYSLDFMEQVAESLYKIGDFETALRLSRQVLHLDATRKKAHYINYTTKTLLKNDTPQTPTLAAKEDSYHTTAEFKRYEKVCRGEITQSPTELRPLRCRYVTNNSPYRLLAPFKVEEHNLDPLVVTYHNMINEENIEILKQMATPRMERSKVRTELFDATSYKTEYRISKNAWLQYHEHASMLQMQRDLHDATGLDMTYCEELQVANYGLGGHYEPHWDFYLDMETIPDDFGNRLATAIFYFSDVEQGGHTAFPFLNVAIRPTKGNMLFWYDLHKSLEGDYRTKHAGCPVLKGSKWIGNVWIRSVTQTFARPCGLQPDHEISLKYATVV